MTRKELYDLRRDYLNKYVPYKMKYWERFNYKVLTNIMYETRSGSGSHDKYNDVIIMADTETSKKRENEYTYDKHGKRTVIAYDNHVVAWTISIRAFNRNIVTLYGAKPSDLCKCIRLIHESMDGDCTIFYWHNLSYDWVFIRKFMFKEFGFPDKQLNTKPHYPIMIQWPDGIIFKDSLILAQRGLDKWAKDLNVEHQKACGKWDYSKLRNQDCKFTDDELEYIEHDTLAGVECIQATKDVLHKHIYSMPYTATGIPREEVRNRGKQNSAKEHFERVCLTYNQYKVMEQVYHGGFTHANRDLVNHVIDWGLIRCKDFSSSYPYTLLSGLFPAEAFAPLGKACSIDYIVRNSWNNAFIFKLILIRPQIKNPDWPMPVLQLSKALEVINPIVDNGRILKADYVSIYLNEIDLRLIEEQYTYGKESACVEVESAIKGPLPKWFTDYVYECYEAKTKLKGGDPVAYSLAKAKLNSLYGMCVQKNIKEDIVENYDTGEYDIPEQDDEEIYMKYIHKHTTILPYQTGVYVTSLAMYNLFQLGKCCDTWIYSDTDSCYGIGWDEDKVAAYNEGCKEALRKNGYGPVMFNNREYWPGIAEDDAEYSEYKVMGAKRYCGRSTEDGELHITVAGVPKKGSVCLENDINNFKPGLIFPGTRTGKNTHTYLYVDDIYIDEKGNETGDSVDLSPCDYLLDMIDIPDWDWIEEDEVGAVQYDIE